MIREFIFFRPRETGFRFFRDPWNMHLLTRDLWINDFGGNNFHIFGDFSVIKARKLRQTRCKTAIRCPQWRMEDWQLTAHHSLVAKQPITIKNSRSTTRVYNTKKVCQVRSVTEYWSLPLHSIGNWWDPEGSKPRSCLIYKATSLLTKEGLLTVSRKPDNIATKSNDNHNVELDEQS